MQVGKYILEKTIGKGGFGEVYIGKIKGTEEQVAIKRVDKASFKNHDGKVGELFKNEITILKEMNHPHIVKYLDFLETSNSGYLVMEYCEGGDLQTLLDNHKQFTLEQSLVYLKQIISGLNALHQKSIIHRDIKLGNLLLSKACLKICDLGFCKRLSQGNKTCSILGTPGSTAPEIIDEHSYGYKCDIFSVGVAFFQMLTGKEPFSSRSFKYQLEDVKKGSQWENDILDYPPQVLDFLRGLLQADPNKRIGWTLIKNHPLIKNNNKPRDGFILNDISNQKQKRKSIILQAKSNKKVKLEVNQENNHDQDIVIKVEDVPMEMSDKKQLNQHKQTTFDPIERLNYLKVMELIDRLFSLPQIDNINITIPAFLLSKKLLIMIDIFRGKYVNNEFYFKLSQKDFEQNQVIFKKLQADCCKLYVNGNLTNENIIKNLNEFEQQDFENVFKQTLVDLFFQFEEVKIGPSIMDEIYNIKLIIISILGGGFYQQWLRADIMQKKEYIQENMSLLF